MVNNIYYVEIPKDYDGFDLIGYLEYIKDNYIDIYQNLKFGDFIENGNESGYRSNGLYIVDKDDNDNLILSFLSNFPDDYGTIPLNFESFSLFEPGYQFETKRDIKCESYMHNNYTPVNLLFLLSKEWKTNYLFTNYCEFIYNNKKYITISLNGISELLSLNDKTIYGRIFTTHFTEFNIYEYDIDLETDEGKFLSKYDMILYI
jgi:hypothetical protein